MLVEVPDTGPLRSRAETMVRMRSRIWEEVGNILRAAALQEPFSPTLARWLAGGRKVTSRDTERIFAKELEPAGARRPGPAAGRGERAGQSPRVGPDPTSVRSGRARGPQGDGRWDHLGSRTQPNTRGDDRGREMR